MKRIFKNEGSPVEAAGNKPLLLSGNDGVWLVYSGTVDLFAVQGDNVEHAGSRTHLFRSDTGQALFGMDPASRWKGVKLLAVGAPGTVLLKLGFPRFLELANKPTNTEPVERLLHLWVTGLSVGVRKALLPKVFTELQIGAETKLENGRNARPSSGTIWVKHLKGASYFMQRRDLPLINGESTGFFPVSSQAWLEAAEETRLLTMDTSGYIHEDPSLSDLERFHQYMMDCIALTIKETDAEERQRLKVKEAYDRAVFENALSRLGSILDPSEAAPVAGEGDALFTACLMIGEKQGIAFRQPGREAMAGRDPLDAIARFSRVRTRQVLLKGEWYRNDHGPLLTFTGENRNPVALLPATPGSYVLHDPSDKSRTRVTAEVAASLAPFAHTFYRPFPDRALKGWDLLKFGLSGSLPDIWLILSVATCGAVLGLVTPIATGIIINTILPNAARSTLGQIALILVTCAVASATFDVTRAIALLRIESKMDASMQSGVMDRLLSLPVPFFRKFSTGDLAERTLGINSMRQIVSGITATAILAGVFSAFNFFLLFYYDQKLALVATLLIVLGIGFSSALSYSNVGHQRRLSGMQGKISGLVFQFFTGISKIRLSGTEDRVFAIWAREFADQKRIAAHTRIIQSVQAIFNSSFPFLASMALFAWIALGSHTLMNAGAFSAFHSAYISFQNAMLQMFAALMAALTIVPLLERAKPILETMPESDVNKASPGILTGDIEVSHVDFRYSSNGPLVLNDVSLHVRPGEFVALVGSSGSGKSTLLRLLLGFELPEAGAIYYDDQDLAALDVREVRRQMGVVLQSGKVMAGDIFKNIVGSSNLTPDNAWEAARMAGFEDDIKEMPMGMNTVMPPGGGTLSGGQRQRLLIARAVVHKPRILYFDEATSALDNRTQEIVSRSLEKLQSTRIVIAHRLSTIVHADRIFVLDRGRIVQSGTYEQLIHQEGLFADLANRQIA